MLPNYGIDADRVLALDGPLDALRRRFDGRYAVDEFGGDPHLTDLLTSLATPVRVHVEHGENIPRTGPALLVANRGVGVIEPVVLALAVRRAAGRRLRVIGAPELPVIGPAFRKVGAIGYRPDDVAALLRAGHLAAAPLSPTWLRSGVGEPPRALLSATLGFPRHSHRRATGRPVRAPAAAVARQRRRAAPPTVGHRSRRSTRGRRDLREGARRRQRSAGPLLMQTITVADGTTIAYHQYGRATGEPLLMLQGLGADSRGWALQRMAFGRRFRCIAVDNRGVGGSSGATRPYSLEEMASDAVAVLDAEGVDSRT